MDISGTFIIQQQSFSDFEEINSSKPSKTEDLHLHCVFYGLVDAINEKLLKAMRPKLKGVKKSGTWREISEIHGQGSTHASSGHSGNTLNSNVTTVEENTTILEQIESLRRENELLQIENDLLNARVSVLEDALLSEIRLIFSVKFYI